MDDRDENRLRQQQRELQANDERLKAAVQYTVGKICDEHTEDGSIDFSQDFVAQLAQLTFGYVSDTWAKDLELFARHGKRSVVNVDDVKLLVRNNPSLLAKLTEQADSIAAIATVQKEQSAKRKQAKKDEKKEPKPSDRGDLVEQEQEQVMQPSAAAPADLDDSFSNIDWDNFDRLTTSKASEICPPPVTLPISSVKAEFDEDDDADLFNIDLDNEIERPSTSRPAHLDSTRLPASSAAGGLKTPLKDGPTTVALNEPTASPDIDHHFSPVERVVTKGAAKKNISESVPKRRSEENKERAPVKKSKHAHNSSRSSVGNSTMVNSFEDDAESVPKRRSEENKEKAPVKKSKHAHNNSRSFVGNSTMVNSFEDDAESVPKRRSEENKEKAPVKKSKHAPNNSRSSVGNSTLVNSFEDDDDDFV